MKFRPGEIVLQSGIYQEVDVLEQWITDITCVKGEYFPPNEAKGFYYKLKEMARHKIKG